MQSVISSIQTEKMKEFHTPNIDTFFEVLFKSEENPDRETLIKFRFILGEFIVNYEGKKGKVQPGTMLGFLNGINRAMKDRKINVNINSNPIFKDNDEGIFALMDNHFAEQQGEGKVRNHHNYIPRCDIVLLLDHAVCSTESVFGYLNRLFLCVGITLGVRTACLYKLEVDQFKYGYADGKKVIIYSPKIGSSVGSSKGLSDGLANMRRPIKPILLFPF